MLTESRCLAAPSPAQCPSVKDGNFYLIRGPSLQLTLLCRLE